MSQTHLHWPPKNDCIPNSNIQQFGSVIPTPKYIHMTSHCMWKPCGKPPKMHSIRELETNGVSSKAERKTATLYCLALSLNIKRRAPSVYIRSMMFLSLQATQNNETKWRFESFSSHDGIQQSIPKNHRQSHAQLWSQITLPETSIEGWKIHLCGCFQK